MTTLIAAYNSEGCIGRCDAKCHDAIEPDCDCICGGMNHGVGVAQAIANTEVLAEEWMKAYQKKTGQQLDFKVVLGYQLSLFELEAT